MIDSEILIKWFVELVTRRAGEQESLAYIVKLNMSRIKVKMK